MDIIFMKAGFDRFEMSLQLRQRLPKAADFAHFPDSAVRNVPTKPQNEGSPMLLQISKIKGQ